MTTKLPVHDEAGQVIGLLGVTREINELKRAEMSLQYPATHDSLTSLPNRFLLMDRLNQALARAQRDAAPFGVLFVDIDDFKAINDSAGHESGDSVLRSIAERLQSSVRASDTIARLGGDEFVVVLEHADRAETSVIADRIRAAVVAPIALQRSSHVVTVTVGISLYPEHAGDASGLLTTRCTWRSGTARTGPRYARRTSSPAQERPHPSEGQSRPRPRTISGWRLRRAHSRRLSTSR